MALLGEKHWKQNKLAQVTGIRESTISDLCREMNVSVTMSNLDLICEALGCQPGDIFTYEANKIPRIERNRRGEPIRRASE